MAKRQSGKVIGSQPTAAGAPTTGRKVLLGVSAAALAAGITASSAPAQALEAVPSLGQRVSAVRALAQANPGVTEELLRENLLTKVQWVNWPNWGSNYVPWNNWHNWHNWGNGFWGNF
ncbi:MAG: hypothetical protein ACHQF3_06940 [Alphaproteobacteria bacterium]